MADWSWTWEKMAARTALDERWLWKHHSFNTGGYVKVWDCGGWHGPLIAGMSRLGGCWTFGERMLSKLLVGSVLGLGRRSALEMSIWESAGRKGSDGWWQWQSSASDCSGGHPGWISVSLGSRQGPGTENAEQRRLCLQGPYWLSLRIIIRVQSWLLIILFWAAGTVFPNPGFEKWLSQSL